MYIFKVENETLKIVNSSAIVMKRERKNYLYILEKSAIISFVNIAIGFESLHFCEEYVLEKSIRVKFVLSSIIKERDLRIFSLTFVRTFTS